MQFSLEISSEILTHFFYKQVKLLSDAIMSEKFVMNINPLRKKKDLWN